MKNKSSSLSGGAPKRRVLIVDDEKDFVLSLVIILESRSYRVEKVHNTTEAIKKIKQFDAQVTLLDIRLGRSSGIDLIAKIKKVRPDILCVMMTAYAAIDTAIEAIQEGAYDYLRKPLDAKDLLATLDRCFEKIKLKDEKEAAEEALRNRNKELEEINARLRKIVESTKEFATCTRLGEIGPLLLEEFARNMATGGGSLFLREGERLVLVHSLDPEHVPATIAFPLKKNSIFEQVIIGGESVLIQDIEKEEGVESSGWEGYKDESLIVGGRGVAKERRKI
jgi:ActR/RegA family two-component response regulator